MNQSEQEAWDQHCRENVSQPLTWKHWVIVAIVSWMAYVFAIGLKTIFSL